MGADGEKTPLEGRWYSRRQSEALDVERYIDVHDDLLFMAVHFRRGEGPFKSEQAVLNIEACGPSGGELDLRVVKLLRDGVDLTSSLEGAVLKGVFRLERAGLLLSLSEPGGRRPADLSGAERYEKR